MDIGPRLRRLRLAAGHTQESLERATGVRRPHIQTLEQGAHSPTINTLQLLVHGCNSSLADFFGSRVPEKYDDPEHQELHEKMQEILEGANDFASACKTMIESIHLAFGMSEEKRAKASREKRRASET